MTELEHIQQLVSRAATKQATEKELEELAEKLRLDHSGEITSAIEKLLEGSADQLTNKVTDWKHFAKEIVAGDTARSASKSELPIRSIPKWKTSWVRYAAAAIAIVVIGAYLWNTQNGKRQMATVKSVPMKGDVLPGGDKGLLILSDGQRIILDNTANGTIAKEGNSNIIKKDGQVLYDNLPSADSRLPVAYNTMSTPRGGQFRLVLPDGSKVWLNAASSITYPTTFVQQRRMVKIKGEVYFEVAKNKQKPFVVDVDGKMAVEVLGTYFNINSYENEASIKTTLLEGSVRIIRAGPTTGVSDRQISMVILKPGEQAQLANPQARNNPNVADGPIKVLRQVDTDQTLAWKNGIFDFNGLDVQGVLRQLERWYDIQVIYEGMPAPIVFKGEMYRNVRLSDVLEKLQQMGGFKFRMEGKKLFVL